jgi:hypothetical protein
LTFVDDQRRGGRTTHHHPWATFVVQALPAGPRHSTPAPASTREQHDELARRFFAAGSASAHKIGIPAGVHTRYSRSPQKNREWLAQ